MTHCGKAIRRSGIAAAFAVAALAGCAFAGGAAPAKEKPEAPAAATPEQKAARTLLERLQIEHTVHEDQKRFLAERRFQVGKTHFDSRAFRAARRQFEKALELDPHHKQAQIYLQKARGLLGAQERGVGTRIGAYINQRQVVLEMRKTELANLFASAKALYSGKRYGEAAQAFTRVIAQAKHLSPHMDVGQTAEEAELLLRRSLQAIREQRHNEAEEQRRKAIEAGERFRRLREETVGRRQEALLERARTHYAHGRYAAARKLCDQVLLKDPANGAAEALREKAVETARRTALDKVLRARASATADHWDRVRADTTPQGELLSISPARVAQLNRQAVGLAIGDSREDTPQWERRVREKLDRPVSFDFVETPLQDVISFLSTLTDVTIILDTDAVRDTAPSVTLKVNKMRLERALNWVCKLVGLKYGLRDEAIYISNRFHDKPVLRMYAVSDITISIQNFKGRSRALATAEGRGEGSQGGGSEVPFFPNDDEKKGDEEPFTGQKLLEFIKKTIAPGTWIPDDEEGFGRADVWE